MNFYFAAVQELDIKGMPKHFASVVKIGEVNLARMDIERNYIIFHPCSTKKHAKELVDFWNEQYRQQMMERQF